MPEPYKKAKEYSFWRWEYVRRNREYLAHFRALNAALYDHGILGIKYPTSQDVVDFQLQDMLVTSSPIDFTSPGNITILLSLSNCMNRIVEQFKILPVPPGEGLNSDQLMEAVINNTLHYEACPASYRPGYRLDEKTARPVVNTSKKQRHAEHDSILAKDDFFQNTSKENLEEWMASLLNFEFENIPSKNFRSNEIARAVGLWVWDRVNIFSQQEANKKSIWNEIRELYRSYPALSAVGLGAIEAGNNDNPESTLRKIYGYYTATSGCISRCEVLTIKG
ncbi:hypothetical protein [Solidesulfovibrio sp.]